MSESDRHHSDEDDGYTYAMCLRSHQVKRRCCLSVKNDRLLYVLFVPLSSAISNWVRQTNDQTVNRRKIYQKSFLFVLISLATRFLYPQVAFRSFNLCSCSTACSEDWGAARAMRRWCSNGIDRLRLAYVEQYA